MAEARQTILGEADVGRVIRRMAHEIVEKCAATDELVLVGIRSRGVHLARRLARTIGELGQAAPPVAVIDIRPFRDDRVEAHGAPLGAIEAAVDERIVILVDDVIYRGRTIRAALDAVERLGEPKRILVAALIDRGARELPIRADIVGKNIDADDGQRVNVRLTESDGIDEVGLAEWDARGARR